MLFGKYRPVFKGIGTFKAVEDVDKRVSNRTYSNDNNPDGKIKNVVFYLDTGEDGQFKLEYTGFNSNVTAFDKKNRENKKTLKYGEKVDEEFLKTYNVLGAFTLASQKNEQTFIYSYEVAETLEKMYSKWEKTETILEVDGEVKLEAYTPDGSTTTMITKYIITGIREISKDSFKKNKLEKEFKLTIPAVIKKSEIEALEYYESPEEASVRIPIYTPIYIRKTKEYIYFQQELILSSKYIFGKSFKDNPDLTASKSIMDMFKTSMIEGNSEYRTIRYEATAINKYEEKKKEFTPEDLNETEKFIYNNYLKDNEKPKFLEYKCKETQYVSSVVRKNFLDLLLISNEVSGYVEPLSPENVCILTASQIDSLNKTGIKPAVTTPKTSITTVNPDSNNTSFFEDDEVKEVPDEKDKPVLEKEEVNEDETKSVRTPEDIIKEAVSNPTPEPLDDDDFPF